MSTVNQRELAALVVAGHVAVRDAARQLLSHESRSGDGWTFGRLLDPESVAPTARADEDQHWQSVTPAVLDACRQRLADRPGSRR